jgi:iron complex outermembrane receptor protein
VTIKSQHKSESLKYLLLFLIIFSSTIILAQTISDSTNVESEIRLNEVIITSDLFQSKRIDFAGSVTGLNTKVLNNANNLYLQPVLNSIAGVHMQSGALNTNRITIRGIGSRSPFATNKIKAYLDEIPLSTGEGETTLEDIDFTTLGGIEVYRGPSSTMYGAGLGGAIHMLTKKTSNYNSLSTDFSVGSFGLKKYNLKVALGNNNHGVNIFYQNVQNDGYRKNNNYSRHSVSTIGKVKLGAKSTLTNYFNITHLKAFIPSSLDEETYLNYPTNAANSWGNAMGFEDNDRIRLGLSLKTIHSKNSESTIAVFTNIGKSREVTPFGNEAINTSNFGLRARFRKSILKEDKLTLVAGTEVFLEQFTIESFENMNSQNGDLTSDLDQRRKYANIFLATEFLPNVAWKISIGTNLNLSSYENSDGLQTGINNASGNQNFDPIISPKFSISRNINKSLSIYSLLAHGFSLPTFDETLNPNGQINESIKPEKGLNVEIGLKGFLFKEKVYFEIAGYTMLIKDLLVARRNSELDFSGFNAGKSKHNGIELSLNHQLLKSNSIDINHSLSYTLMDYSFDEFIDDDRGDFSGNDLTGVPDHTLNYQITIETSYGFYTNINLQNVGEMPILDDNSIVSAAYDIVNFKAGFKRRINKFTLNIHGGINNLLDEKYAAMLQINPRFNQRYFYPGLPINYYSGIIVVYKF